MEISNIVIYPDCYFEGQAWTFEPLPIETILRHLAGLVDGAVRWEYWDPVSIGFVGPGKIWFVNRMGDVYKIPAPYREDWQSVGGEL